MCLLLSVRAWIAMGAGDWEKCFFWNFASFRRMVDVEPVVVFAMK